MIYIELMLYYDNLYLHAYIKRIYFYLHTFIQIYIKIYVKYMCILCFYCT